MKGSSVLQMMYKHLEDMYAVASTKEEFEEQAQKQGYSMNRLEAFYKQRSGTDARV